MRKINQKGIDLIKSFESLELQAYVCPAGVLTIGYGNTFYEDGTKVKKGDKITVERAKELFENVLYKKFIPEVDKLVSSEVNDNQFSALVSFAYNVGIGNFGGSTLLKLVNVNPDNPNIAFQFSRWNKSGGKILPGLTRRRKAESDLYFS